MTSEIVGIHGMAKHQSGRNQLLPTWERALRDGLEEALGERPRFVPSLDLAFYGSVFLDEPRPGDPVTMGGKPEEALFADLGDAEMHEIVTTAEEVFGTEELADAAGRVAMGFSYVPAPLAAVMRTLDRRFGRAGAVLHVAVLRQVRRYLVDADTRARVDPRVVTAAGGCRVLVGHSLGSVVGYRYLQQNPGHGVDLFLTLGSPLGLRMVRDRITVGRLDVPRWVNVWDPHDPVACAGNLAQWWPQVRDETTRNGMDAHAVQRYLGKKVTGEALLREFPKVAA
jgi:hypothetical protein